MQIHECFNFTPFAIDLGFCLDAEGGEVAVAILKATYRFTLAGRVSRAEKEALVPVFKADVFEGEPDRSSLRYAGDFVPVKPGTDVAVNGHVYGFGQARAQARLEVADLAKTVEAVGPRLWSTFAGRPLLTDPAPFEKVALRYEEAFGGFDMDEAQNRVAFAENPVGVGFLSRPRAGAPLPRLEDPKQPVKSVADRPPPASLGFIPCGWKQRARWAGTFDSAWESSRRPLFPADFDPRFFNAVPQDQVLGRKLAGGETLVLNNLHSKARRIALQIPAARFVATFRARERVEALPMEADTLLVEPDQERLAVTYRASHPLEFDLRYVKSVTFEEAKP